MKETLAQKIERLIEVAKCYAESRSLFVSNNNPEYDEDLKCAYTKLYTELVQLRNEISSIAKDPKFMADLDNIINQVQALHLSRLEFENKYM